MRSPGLPHATSGCGVHQRHIVGLPRHRANQGRRGNRDQTGDAGEHRLVLAEDQYCGGPGRRAPRGRPETGGRRAAPVTGRRPSRQRERRQDRRTSSDPRHSSYDLRRASPGQCELAGVGACVRRARVLAVGRVVRFRISSTRLDTVDQPCTAGLSQAESPSTRFVLGRPIAYLRNISGPPAARSLRKNGEDLNLAALE